MSESPESVQRDDDNPVIIPPATVMPAAPLARPVAVTVVAVIMLVLNGYGLIQSVGFISVLFMWGSTDSPIMLNYIASLIVCSLGIISAFGLFKMREWARNGMIYTEIASIALKGIFSIFILGAIGDLSLPVKPMYNSVGIVAKPMFAIGVMAAVIYVLTRPPIMAAFKQQRGWRI